VPFSLDLYQQLNVVCGSLAYSWGHSCLDDTSAVVERDQFRDAGGTSSTSAMLMREFVGQGRDIGSGPPRSSMCFEVD
jgi:hypothetical protein